MAKVGDKIICQRIEIPDWMGVTKGRSYEVQWINYNGDFTGDGGAPASEYWIDNDKGERVPVLASEWSVLKPDHVQEKVTMAQVSDLPVKGYQPQPQPAIDLVNRFKEMEERILREIDTVSALEIYNPRWAATARTHIEQGFMALNRSVFNPQRITLPEDGGR